MLTYSNVYCLSKKIFKLYYGIFNSLREHD